MIFYIDRIIFNSSKISSPPSSIIIVYILSTIINSFLRICLYTLYHNQKIRIYI